MCLDLQHSEWSPTLIALPPRLGKNTRQKRFLHGVRLISAATSHRMGKIKQCRGVTQEAETVNENTLAIRCECWCVLRDPISRKRMFNVLMHSIIYVGEDGMYGDLYVNVSRSNNEL
jgi:hypothetical protein